jgi:acetyltransferase-like isoleucine patch superfamily enzyme
MTKLLSLAKKWLIIALRGKEAYARVVGVRIGQGCRILIHDFGSEPFLVTIGDRVTVTTRVLFLTHDGSTWLMRDGRGRRQRYGAITVGSDVFIGAGAILMPGVTVGDRCVIGAGSVVTKSLPAGSVVAGNPARWITSYDAFIADGLASLPADCDYPAGLPIREKVAAMLPRCPVPAVLQPPTNP